MRRILAVAVLASAGSELAAAAQCGPEEIQQLGSPYSSISDGFGGSLALSPEYFAVSESGNSAVSWFGGVVFLFERRADLLWTSIPTAELRVPDPVPGLLNNCSLAIDGDTVVLGTPDDDELGPGSGAVYVFRRTGPAPWAWRLVAQLTASDGKRDDGFGQAVAIEGDTLVVGAPRVRRRSVPIGAAYVFRRTGASESGWIETQRLAPENPRSEGRYGFAVALDSDTLAVSALSNGTGPQNGGAVFVHERNDGQWSQAAILTVANALPSDLLGVSIALDGDTLAAGAIGDDHQNLNSGAVHVFERTAGTWQFATTLKSVGNIENDEIGYRVGLEGDLIVAGAPQVDAVGVDSGAVYVFAREPSSGTWVQQSRLTPADLAATNQLATVAISNGIIAAGARKPLHPGAAYLFAGRVERRVATYCQPSGGSLPGCLPEIDYLGAPSASGNATFDIRAGPLPGQQFGVFLYSHAAGTPTPIESAGICLPGRSLQRSATLWSGGTAGVCDGQLVLDWNEFLKAAAPVDPLLSQPGAQIHGQFAYFSPFSTQPVGLSDAVVFTLCP